MVIIIFINNNNGQTTIRPDKLEFESVPLPPLAGGGGWSSSRGHVRLLEIHRRHPVVGDLVVVVGDVPLRSQLKHPRPESERRVDRRRRGGRRDDGGEQQARRSMGAAIDFGREVAKIAFDGGGGGGLTVDGGVLRRRWTTKMTAFDGSGCVQWQLAEWEAATRWRGKRGRSRHNNQIVAAAGGD